MSFSPKKNSTIYLGNQSWIFGQKMKISNSVIHSYSHHLCAVTHSYPVHLILICYWSITPFLCIDYDQLGMFLSSCMAHFFKQTPSTLSWITRWNCFWDLSSFSIMRKNMRMPFLCVVKPTKLKYRRESSPNVPSNMVWLKLIRSKLLLFGSKNIVKPA